MANDLFWFPAFTMAEPPWKLLARMQINSVALISRRVQAYMELPNTLASCRTPQDLLTEQVRFLQIAQRHYMAGAEKMLAGLPMPVAEPRPAADARAVAKPRDYMVVSEREPATRRAVAHEETSSPKDTLKAPRDEEARPRVRRSA